jgi:hypothetical protein
LNALQDELPLTDKRNFDKDEKHLRDVLNADGRIDPERFIEASGEVLLSAFPNPQRLGCPGDEALRGLAAHKLSLSETEAWSKHLSGCSECYADYLRFRKTEDKGRSVADEKSQSPA